MGENMSNKTLAIKMHDVYKSYDNNLPDSERKYVLNGISLDIIENEFVCVLGKSGCGKSTFLNLIAGYLKPDKGHIFIADKEVAGPSADCGVVFQGHALFPWYTVKKNIAFGPKIRGKTRKEIDEIAAKYVDMIGLQGYENAFPNSLSGGMAQRVGIARALANDPEVLLMDEPFGALDAITREKMRQEMISIWQKTKMTIVFITHSVPEAVYLANRVVLFKDGKIGMERTIDIPYPRDTKSKEFLDYVSEFEAGLVDKTDDTDTTLISE